MSDIEGRDVLFSSSSVEWGTPQHIFDALDAEFRFTIDVCATEHNHKCDIWFGHDVNEFGQQWFCDGLTADWSKEVCFMNPPYKKRVIDEWVRKAYMSATDGATVVCLVPARVDVKWWNDYCVYAHEIRFVERRIKFEQDGKDNTATFPSAIVVFRGKPNDEPYMCVKQWKQPKGERD